MSNITFSAASVQLDHQHGNAKTILHPTDLAITNPRTAVVGANGSGKSTLLRLINGLRVPTSGSVTVQGLDTQRQGRQVRARVGFVFTDPIAQLVMPTPREDIELSLRKSHPRARERREAALAILDDYRLGHLAENSIYELSGGERQLVALASVLAVSPDILVLDEPSTLLDLRNTRLLRQQLLNLPQQLVMATHDLELAATFDRVLVMHQAAVVYDGSPAEAIAFYRNVCADDRQWAGSEKLTRSNTPGVNT